MAKVTHRVRPLREQQRLPVIRAKVNAAHVAPDANVVRELVQLVAYREVRFRVRQQRLAVVRGNHGLGMTKLSSKKAFITVTTAPRMTPCAWAYEENPGQPKGVTIGKR